MIQEYVHIIILVYLAVINLAAIIMTVKDKRAAQQRLRRTAESTLLFIAFIGGSIAMFLTMRGVRHKTTHTKFMVGIPVIIVLQIAAAVFVWYRLNGGVLEL